MHGLITQPDYSRANAKGYYFFINGRFVKDALISHAVMTGYRRVIPEKRYPVLVFFIDLPPEEVDVNVHPAKTEVRFRNPRDIYDCVVETIVAKLAAVHEGERDPYDAHREQTGASYHQRVEEALKRYTLVTGGSRPTYAHREERRPEPPLMGLWRDPAARSDVEPLPGMMSENCLRFSELAYLGQVGATYLIFSGGDKLVVMDQHAAHERILFEKIRSDARKRAGFQQALLVPEVLSLSPAEYEQFIQSRDILTDAGIDMEPFGGHSLVLKTVPAPLANLSPKQFLPDLVGEVLAGGKTASTLALKEKLFAVMACKGAVKANHTLAAEEVKALCAEMDNTPFNATCPHGRPVYLVYHLTDLEKLFKRT